MKQHIQQHKQDTLNWKTIEKRVDSKIDNYLNEVQGYLSHVTQFDSLPTKLENVTNQMKEEQQRLDQQIEVCISKINTLVEMHNQTRVEIKDNYRIMQQLIEKTASTNTMTPIAASSHISHSLNNSKRFNRDSPFKHNLDFDDFNMKDKFDLKLSQGNGRAKSPTILPLEEKNYRKSTKSADKKVTDNFNNKENNKLKKNVKVNDAKINRKKSKNEQPTHKNRVISGNNPLSIDQKKRQKILNDVRNTTNLNNLQVFRYTKNYKI